MTPKNETPPSEADATFLVKPVSSPPDAPATDVQPPVPVIPAGTQLSGGAYEAVGGGGHIKVAE